MRRTGATTAPGANKAGALFLGLLRVWLKSYCACQYVVAKALKMLMYTPYICFFGLPRLVLAAAAQLFNKPLKLHVVVNVSDVLIQKRAF